MNNILPFFKDLLKETYKTSLILFKIMIPVSIIVKILQEADMIKYIGYILQPLMKLAGLPGEMGIVWATGMISNLYGGILCFLTLSPKFNLTTAQITVLTLMMLVAHTFPIELFVARKAGVRLHIMFIIRFCFGLLMGIILNYIYITFNYLQTEPEIKYISYQINDNTVKAWITGELRNYVYIFIAIFILITLMKFLKQLGIIRLINKILGPIVRVIGISEDVIPITIIGLTLGVSYGGALIIKESEDKTIDRRDVFYSLVLMGLCHSLIEDTLLMMSIGGNFSGVFIFRLIAMFVIMYIIVFFTKKIPDKLMYKYLLHQKKHISIL
jgi:hypothetical protein